MKNLVLILSLVTTSLFAQNGINYQGAATDSDGAKLADQNISLKTSVLQGGVGGTTSYSETHNTITDQFGLFNVVIGQGEVVSGAFEGISWGADTHFLKVELDATGGTDYNLISTTQMMSVPYALYAENSGLDSAMLANMIGSSGGLSSGVVLSIYENHIITPQEVLSNNIASSDGFLYIYIDEAYINMYLGNDSNNLRLIPINGFDPDYGGALRQTANIFLREGDHFNFDNVNDQNLPPDSNNSFTAIFIPISGGGSISSTPSSIDSAMVADMIAANTSSSAGGDWELLYDELNTNFDLPWGTVNRYGIAQSDGFLYLLGSNVTVFTGNDHDTITNTWPENPLLQYITSSDPLEPNLIPLKKNMSWHLEFHSTQGYITKGYFIPNAGGSSSLANGGMSGTSKSFKFPDGLNGEFVVIDILEGNYTVPDGKNLYILNAMTDVGNQLINLNGKRFIFYDSDEWKANVENVMVGSGYTLSNQYNSSDGVQSSTMFGFLANKKVEFVAIDILEGNYTVPEDKNLYILNAMTDAGNQIINLNAKRFIFYDSDKWSDSEGFVMAGPGSVLSNQYNSSDGVQSSTMFGYLADLDYFESYSSSSASNSGGGGNTMDLSVSQFGDTLFGLGNDFLIIPGLSQSNLHMQFNEYGSVTDDWGNTYKTLIYGDAEWMVENLRSPIGDYKTVSDHSGGFQSYEDSVGYYYSASDISSNVCPTGWHVSTIQDWQDLHYEIYGTNMNPNGYTNPGNGYDDNNYSILWSQYQGGTNQSAFNLFRTGYWDNSGSYITSEPETANFWSTDGCNGSGLYRVNLIHGNDSFNPWALDVGCTSTSNVKAQVRCVKD